MTKHLESKPDAEQYSGPITMDTEDAAWLSSILSTEDMDSMLRITNQQELARWSVYTSIDDLPFSVFEDVSVDENLSLLARVEGAPEELLIHAWNMLQSQFSEAVGGETTAMATALTAEVEMLDNQISLVQLIVDEMQRVSDEAEAFGIDEATIQLLREPFAQTLQDWDFDREFSSDSWRQDLEWVVNSAKNFVMMRDGKAKEREDLLPTDKDGRSNKPTHESYATALWNISKYAKFALNKAEITTRTFCIAYRDYLNYVEAEKNRQAKGQIQPSA